MDRVYCGEKLPDGTRCRGVHTCEPKYNVNGDVMILTIVCTNPKCIYKEVTPERRKQSNTKLNFEDRRKTEEEI